jgi:hypothetical protein
MDGWIKIYRSITKHWIWDDSMYLKAWLTILITVNYEYKKVLVHGQIIDCNRGQSLLSLSSWAKAFGRKWSVQRVRTFFSMLEKDGMIVTEGMQKTTRLTVCNYDSYQDQQQANNKQLTSKQQATNKQLTTTKERKERKERKEGKEYNISFDFFWNTYDYKVGRPKAEKAWAGLTDEQREKVMEHLKVYIPSTPDKKFRKHPTTYLNNKSWEDEVNENTDHLPRFI